MIDFKTATLAAVALCCAAGVHAQGFGSATIDNIRTRGQLSCGIASDVAGFSLPDSQGVERGIDADGCRILAAAVLGDASKVKFVPTTVISRFTALQSGEIDVLIRETTWTLGREASMGLEFANVNFYDGTGFLVKKTTNITSVKQMDGSTVCVQPGTSTELALADYFRRNKMKLTVVEIQDVNQVIQAFVSGRCDAYSSDSSALAGVRFQQGPKAEDFVLLPEIIDKEPLGPMVRKGDEKWLDVARWTHYAVLTAEEYGITSKNIDSFADTDNPDIKRLLGTEGDMGKALGLDNRWAYNAIKQVGNFGEIWERNITPLGVPRGINNLWNRGGLQYAPPIR